MAQWLGYPPANPRDKGSIPAPGRFPMLQSHNFWNSCTLEPVLGNKRSHENEKPEHHNETEFKHNNEDPAMKK